ncbi:MAG: Hg(II)-responsive transcriptional regulator [Burkholderiales bacterium]|nr:Hg(II)-responsive transcriptional regulator [Burkholderiales bacterium]
METTSDSLTIGTLADGAGVSVESIRFYQRKGLLHEPKRPYGSIRRYSDSDVGRVRFIKAAQRIGFTLDEIAQLLQLEDGTQCAQAKDIAEHKLADVRRRVADLQRIESALAGLVERCAAGRGRVTCPLITSLQETS